MGTLILDMVVELLKEGGIRAEAAQPDGDMTAVQTPVAAVSLESVDQADESVTVLVEMVGPVHAGARRCQTRALDAMEILGNAGGVCRMGKCTFISKADMFYTPVTAVFYGTALSEEWLPRRGYAVMIGGSGLPYVTGFSAQQQETEGVAMDDAPWEFTLEEFLPAGTPEGMESEENFVLEVFYGTAGVGYTGCRFISRQRFAEPNGIRQIRRGMADQRVSLQ